MLINNSYGHRAISCSVFRRRSESEPYGDCREIVGYSNTFSENRMEPDVREESLRFLTEHLGLPTIATYDFLSPHYHTKSFVGRTSIVGFPYSARTTCLLSYYCFLKKCKSADYYKIVEATEIVGSRRILGIS